MEDSDGLYRSKVQVHREGGSIRTAALPAREEPITFGVHSEIADHYDVDTEDEPAHAATLDYLVASAAG